MKSCSVSLTELQTVPLVCQLFTPIAWTYITYTTQALEDRNDPAAYTAIYVQG